MVLKEKLTGARGMRTDSKTDSKEKTNPPIQSPLTQRQGFGLCSILHATYIHTLSDSMVQHTAATTATVGGTVWGSYSTAERDKKVYRVEAAFGNAAS